MERRELLKLLDREMLESLYGFSYARTGNSTKADELCSDIVFAIVKAARKEGEIEHPRAFLWRVARNVYADYAKERRCAVNMASAVDVQELSLPEEGTDEEEGRIEAIKKQIAFLGMAYREVMVAYYFEGLSVRCIAERMGTSENAIRQRLFSARNQVREGVLEMEESKNERPIEYERVDFYRCGTGNPTTSPWPRCARTLSSQIVAICNGKWFTPVQVSGMLHIPTLYVEEEMSILSEGYGLLREKEGRYTTNIVLFTSEQIKEAWTITIDLAPVVADAIEKAFLTRREELLARPFLNHRVEENLVRWLLVRWLSYIPEKMVIEAMRSKMPRQEERLFTAYGYDLKDARPITCGIDGIKGMGLCGYDTVAFCNYYNKYIRAHFHCEHNISTDGQLQMAIKALGGLAVEGLNEEERETASNAIARGYLMREGDMLWTRILSWKFGRCGNGDCSVWDNSVVGTDDLVDYTEIQMETDQIARRLGDYLNGVLPAHLLSDWEMGVGLAMLPMEEKVLDILVERGVLIPEADGIGAVGCFMQIKE